MYFHVHNAGSGSLQDLKHSPNIETHPAQPREQPQPWPPQPARNLLSAPLLDAVSSGRSTRGLKLKVLSPEGDGITVACSEVILPSATGQLGGWAEGKGPAKVQLL